MLGFTGKAYFLSKYLLQRLPQTGAITVDILIEHKPRPAEQCDRCSNIAISLFILDAFIVSVL